MREAKFVAAILVAMLFVFGCTSPQPPAGAGGQNNTSGGGPTAPSGAGAGAETGAAGGAGAETNVSGGAGAGTNVSGGVGTGGSGGTDSFTGKDWAGLMALGVPMQCDVSADGSTTTMYVVDQGRKIRMEASSEGCSQTVIIIKDQKMYMKCVDEPMFEGCDWIQYDVSAQGPSGGTGQGSQVTDYENAPASSLDCAAWVPDNSKFDTPGNVCNLQDMMGGGAYPGGYN
ncbi:MAG: hypothetical protein AB1529_03790 [Candidatus Micrarchaeota archaeon]